MNISHKEAQQIIDATYGYRYDDPLTKIHELLQSRLAEVEQAERVEPVAKVTAVSPMDFIARINYTPLQNGNPPIDIGTELYLAPPAAALAGGTVASGNIIGAVASGNQLSGAHNIRSK